MCLNFVVHLSRSPDGWGLRQTGITICSLGCLTARAAERQRVFSVPGTDNTFAGVGAGANNTSGSRITAFGAQAGASNQTANTSAYFGYAAGENDITGINAFFGGRAGRANVSGGQNSFFGEDAGTGNVSSSNNAYFGQSTGRSANGNGNSYFGEFAGAQDLVGNFNTLLGYNAQGQTNLTTAIAIGANAKVDQDNSLVLGSIAGVNGAPASVNVGIGTTTPVAALDTRGTLLVSGNVGLGTTAPTAKLDIRVNQALIRFSGVSCGANFGAITFGNVALGCTNYSLLGEGVNTFINRPAGGALLFRENNVDQMVIQSGGTVTMNSFLRLNQIDSGFGAGTVQLCRNAAGVVAVCTSSSLRFKTQIAPFSDGVSLIRRLRPISFTWKMDGSRDVGLGAEDVAKVEPLLVTHDDKGEIEGVKYDRLNIVLINAIRQQQEQIETLQAANAALSVRLRSVQKTVRK